MIFFSFLCSKTDGLKTSITRIPPSIMFTKDDDNSDAVSTEKTTIVNLNVNKGPENSPNFASNKTSTTIGALKMKRLENENRFRRLHIRAPKLRESNKTFTTKKPRVSFASGVRVRSVKQSNLKPNYNIKTNLINVSATIKTRTNPWFLDFYNQTQSSDDIFEISSSESKPSVLEHESSRYNSMRLGSIRSKELKRPNTPNSRYSSNRISKSIPKLLLPNISRPAMYSLDGYVPKPNLQRLTSTTTEAPVTSAHYKKYIIKNRTTKLQSLDSSTSKRRKVREKMIFFHF